MGTPQQNILDNSTVLGERFGIGENVIYDEELYDVPYEPSATFRNICWAPTGTDTDPLAYSYGPEREYLIPKPGRPKGLLGLLPDQYTTKWPKPGHLFRGVGENDLKKKPFAADNFTPNNAPIDHYKTPFEHVVTNVNQWYISMREMTRGRLMAMKDAIENLPTEQTTAQDRQGPESETTLHELLTASWTETMKTAADFKRKNPPPMPRDAVADVHHFETEFRKIDPFPPENPAHPDLSPLSLHDKVHLFHQRLGDQEGRILRSGQPLIPRLDRKKHHIDYDKWTEDVAHLYLVPHINLQELSDPTRLMQFIYSRTTVAPIHFMQQDFQSTHLGRALRILTGPFSLHCVHWEVPQDGDLADHTDVKLNFMNYGFGNVTKLKLKGESPNMLYVGDAWVTLKAQEVTYRFLRKFCIKLLGQMKVGVGGFKVLKQPEIAIKDKKTLLEDSRAAKAEFSLGAKDPSPTAMLASAPFHNHLQRVEDAGHDPTKILRESLSSQLDSATDHLVSLIKEPEYFHMRMQEEYDQNYLHLYPPYLHGDEMRWDVFIDLLRNVFRRPLTEMTLLDYVDDARKDLEESERQYRKYNLPTRISMETAFRVRKQTEDKIPERVYKSGISHRLEDFLCEIEAGRLPEQLRDLDFIPDFWEWEKAQHQPEYYLSGARKSRSLRVQVRGMLACMHYIIMITRKCPVASTPAMRKYYKKQPNLKKHTGPMGSVITPRLRRALRRFPPLDPRLNSRGRREIVTDQRIRSLHKLLVEFLASEEITEVITLGKLLRRIAAVKDSLETADDRFHAIRQNISELLDSMAAIYLFVEQESVLNPAPIVPLSRGLVEMRFARAMRANQYQAEWLYELKSMVSRRLEKLDEFPIENRITLATLRALYDQHKRWVKRQRRNETNPSRDAARDKGGDKDRDTDNEKTLEALDAFWKGLVKYLRKESLYVPDGIPKVESNRNQTVQGGPPPDPPAFPPVREILARNWIAAQFNMGTIDLWKFLVNSNTGHVHIPGIRGQISDVMENWKAMEHLKYINAFSPQSVPNNLLKLTILLPQTARDFVQERLQNLSQNDFQMIRKEEVVFIWAFAVHYALEVEKAQNLALNSCAYSSGLHANAISMKASYVPLIPKWLERVLGDGDELPYDHDGKDDSAPAEPEPQIEVEQDLGQSMDLSFLTQLIGSRQGSPRPSHDVLVRNAVAAFSAPPPPPPPPLPREPSPENAGLEQEKNAQEDGDEVMEDAEDAVDNMQGRVQGFHYWWLSSLNDKLWQQLVQRHGGFVDESTGTRRTHREIPPGVRRAYMARVQQAAQEESDSETGGGVSNIKKKSIQRTFRCIFYRDIGNGQRTNAVTTNSFREFMAAIGWSSVPNQGSMLRFTYDARRGLFPPSQLSRHQFVIHMPHASDGRTWPAGLIDSARQRLKTLKIDYSSITKYYSFQS